MFHSLRGSFTALVAVAVTSSSRNCVSAITNGEFDTTNKYPAVGTFMANWGTWGGVVPFCSGTLIAPNVFLTAQHCTEYLADQGFLVESDDGTLVPNTDNTGTPIIWLTFDTDPLDGDAPGPTCPGNCIEFERVIEMPPTNGSDLRDLAVVILKDDIGITPVPFAPYVDYAKHLEKEDLLTVVGFGSSYVQDRPNPVKERLFQRQYADTVFNHLQKFDIFALQVRGQDKSGTCNGDSGGPILDYTGVLVAVTSTGDFPCVATGFYYRVDTDASQEFLLNVIDQYS